VSTGARDRLQRRIVAYGEAVASVRYIVNGVDEAIAFDTAQLGFDVVMHPAPEFAMLSRDDLRLLLSLGSDVLHGSVTIS